MTRKECKRISKDILKGQWFVGFAALLIQGLINAALATLTAGIGAFLFSSIITIAGYKVFINGYAGKKYQIEDMFSNLNESLTNRICLSVLKNIFIFLWTLLLFIPGIIKSYSYYLAEFISMKNPELTAKECITKSREVMNGHKWELFVFQLSFIGWVLLSILTFGILNIWLMPYISQATIVYIDKNIYKLLPEEEIKEELEVSELEF